MGVSERVSQFGQGLQTGVKNGSMSLGLFFFKLLTGLVIGLTFSLVGREIFQYENFMFVFVIISVTGIFVRTARSWTPWVLITFDVIAVLVAMLMRMYILIAPG